MSAFVRFGLIALVSLAWVYPAFQVFRVLDGIHALDIVPDAANLRSALEALKWTIGAMSVAVIVWSLLQLGARSERDAAALRLEQFAEMQRRTELAFEQLTETVRNSTATVQNDFGNFTSVGTRLRGALEARLSNIEALVQQSLDQPAAPATALVNPRVEERLAALERSFDAALRDIGATLAQSLRGLQSDLQDREQKAVTDFGMLDSRLTDDTERWDSRLGRLESLFADLTRKTTLDGAQVTANLKLMNLRIKDLTAAVQH